MAKQFWAAFFYLFAIAFSTFASAANELVISEYIESTANTNQAIELCNPSSTSVDLRTDDYVLQEYMDGGTSPISITLTGTVPAGGSFVIAFVAAKALLKTFANQTSISLTFDGNDAIVLRKGGADGTVVDSFGQVGVSAIFGQDKTYRKKSCALRDVVTTDTFDRTVQYDEFTTGFTGLQSCPFDCGQITSPTASPTSSPTASPTSSPTASPTSSPTASPTSSPTASPTSSPTASPTSSPTASPTDMFDWYLKRVGDVTAKTNDPTGSVQLIVDQSKVTQSAVWTQEVGATTARIDVCVRTSLLLTVDSTSTVYNFDEQKVSVTINLAQGFEVAAIDVDRGSAAENNVAAEKNYGLVACHCDASYECAPNRKIFQGDPVYICIKTTADSGIEIASVKELTYTQGTVPALVAVAAASPLGLTKVATEGTNARVQTQLPATFFVAANQDIPVVASGTVVLRFGSGQARNLRFTIGESVDHMHESSASRLMQDQTNTTETGFSVSMALAPLESEDAPTVDSKTGAIIGGIVGGIAGVAMIIVALVLAAHRSRRKKEDDYKEGVYKDEAYTEDDYKDDKEDDHQDEAFKEEDDKEEYAMTGSEIYA